MGYFPVRYDTRVVNYDRRALHKIGHWCHFTKRTTNKLFITFAFSTYWCPLCSPWNNFENLVSLGFIRSDLTPLWFEPKLEKSLLDSWLQFRQKKRIFFLPNFSVKHPVVRRDQFNASNRKTRSYTFVLNCLSYKALYIDSSYHNIVIKFCPKQFVFPRFVPQLIS